MFCFTTCEQTVLSLLFVYFIMPPCLFSFTHHLLLRMHQQHKWNMSPVRIEEKKKKKQHEGLSQSVMVMRLHSLMLFSWNETDSEREAHWKGHTTYKWVTSRRKRKEKGEWNRTCFVIIRSACTRVCAAKELSHCYVNQYETFMSEPSPRSQPTGMVHEWPMVCWLLSETHLQRKETLWIGSACCRDIKPEREEKIHVGGQRRGPPLLTWMEKENLTLPEQLSLCKNNKKL